MPHGFYLALRSKVGVKVKGHGRGQMLRSHFLHAVVDIRGSALPSAAKSDKIHYQSKVCVSVISQRVWIRLTGF